MSVKLGRREDGSRFGAKSKEYYSQGGDRVSARTDMPDVSSCLLSGWSALNILYISHGYNERAL